MNSENATPQRPEWLNDGFLRNVISADGLNGQTFSINTLQLKYAVPKGENFMSVMIRVIINGEDDKSQGGDAVDQEKNQAVEKRYVLKVGHTEAEIKDINELFEMFAKETDMYVLLIPDLYKLLEASGIPDKFCCRCLYAERQNDVIALEDLTQLGYTVRDKNEGLNLQHCEQVYYKLALFHASAMEYLEMHTPDKLKPFYFGYLRSTNNEAGIISPQTLNENVKLFAQVLNLRAGYEKESECIQYISNNFYDIFTESTKATEGSIFNTLNHGDLWNNNIMFANEDGKGLDAILLDLQLCYYTSIAWDFLYFFVTSTNTQVVQNHFNDLIYYYIDTLKSALLKLGYNGTIPTFDQLKLEIRSKSPSFVYLISHVMLFMKNQLHEEDSSSVHRETVEYGKMFNGSRGNPAYQAQAFAVVDLMKRENIFFTN